MFLVTKSECVAPEDICTQDTFMHGQKFQSNGSRELKRKNLHVWEIINKITKYALKNILPGNANIQKIL